ncbi:hypothetical protein [Sphingomonas bacterium]|uniref:hypothetical protein n=1 Tax=Sphingomonas bacterium TaxID=1895847 RepID=UPI0020C6F6D5|nr:hypothetical protein [Sphingomonas bacterium]
MIDRVSGRFGAVAPEPRWDVEDFAISDDGTTIAYTVNEAGISRVRLLDVASGRVRTAARVPVGVVTGLHWAQMGGSVSRSRPPPRPTMSMRSTPGMP